MNSSCPYCHKVLDKIPTRKKTCPHCGKDIYVRKGKLRTHNEAIFLDAKASLLSMGLKGVGTAKNTDDLWRILNENILIASKKNDLQQLSSIYLQMGIICFDEGRYKDCIKNYLLCSHFSSVEAIRSHREYGGELKLSDLMRIDSYMIASPVISSLEELKLEGVDTNNLGILAITPNLTLDEKISILKEAFEGNIERLSKLSDEDKVIVKERNYDSTHVIEVPIQRKTSSGCLGVFIIIFTLLLIVTR
jgi:predicted RNA-binding Zn-ribbon protein involved in translation (DUF1610 family)